MKHIQKIFKKTKQGGVLLCMNNLLNLFYFILHFCSRMKALDRRIQFTGIMMYTIVKKITISS